jgi:hypothetical protein
VTHQTMRHMGEESLSRCPVHICVYLCLSVFICGCNSIVRAFPRHSVAFLGRPGKLSVTNP